MGRNESICGQTYQMSDGTVLQFVVFIEKKPKGTGLGVVVRFKRYLSFGQPTKQLVNYVFSSSWVIHNSFDLQLFGQIYYFSDSEGTVNFAAENFLEEVENALFFLYCCDVITESRVSGGVLAFNYWKFISVDQIEKNLILVQNSLFSFIPQHKSAIQSLVKSYISSDVKHHFANFSSIVDQYSMLNCFCAVHYSNLLISFIELISGKHGIIYSTGFVQLSQ